MYYLLAFLIAALPALFWLLIYYHSDRREEPENLIVKCFYTGALATLPLLLLQFVFNRFPQYNFLELFRSSAQTHWKTVLVLMFAAVLEETIKLTVASHIINKYKKAHDEITDGIIYFVVSALGFAFIENVFYLSAYLGSYGLTPGFTGVFFVRSFGVMLGHTVFSGIFGYIYGLAYIKPYLTEIKTQASHHTKEVLRKIRFKHFSFHALIHLLFNKPVPGGHDALELFIESFILAILLHVIFNFSIGVGLFGANLTYLVVPTIFWFFTLLIRRLKLGK